MTDPELIPSESEKASCVTKAPVSEAWLRSGEGVRGARGLEVIDKRLSAWKAIEQFRDAPLEISAERRT